MPKLKCISNYVNQPAGLVYVAGQTFEVDDAMALFLRTDSPGSFKPYTEPKAKRKAKPKAAADKSVKEPDDEKPKSGRASSK